MGSLTRSIGGKFFLASSALLIAASAILYSVAIVEIKSFYYRSQKESLLQKCRLLKPWITELMENEERLQKVVQRIGKASGVRITVIEKGGRVLADSQHDPETMENHWTRPEVQEALNKGIGSSVRYSATLGRYLMYVAVPIMKGEELAGILRLSYHLSDLNVPLNQLRKKITLWTLLVLIIGLITSYLLSRGLTKDIERLSATVSEIASGNFNTPIHTPKTEEIRRLAIGVKTMQESLKHLFTRIEEERENLRNILSSMPDAVALIRDSGEIVYENERFRKISGDAENLWDVLRSPEIVETIHEAKDKGIAKTELEMRGRIYEMNAIQTSEGEVLVILHDITEKERLNKMKTEFVANVSHELKTPITVISGYAETIEESQDVEEAKELARIIKKHADRMARIVSDLLLLSSIEEGSGYKYEDVNMKEIVENVVERERESAIRKGLTIEKYLEDITVKGVPYLLEQMVENIIRNAVNYTESGSITVILRKRDGRCVLEVKDTGIGIPEEHLHRVFERFYRVDKSRSRSTGGTGLGLSIVKHVVKLHRGEVSIKSRVNQGTTVTVILPIG